MTVDSAIKLSIPPPQDMWKNCPAEIWEIIVQNPKLSFTDRYRFSLSCSYFYQIHLNARFNSPHSLARELNLNCTVTELIQIEEVSAKKSYLIRNAQLILKLYKEFCENKEKTEICDYELNWLRQSLFDPFLEESKENTHLFDKVKIILHCLEKNICLYKYFVPLAIRDRCVDIVQLSLSREGALGYVNQSRVEEIFCDLQKGISCAGKDIKDPVEIKRYSNEEKVKVRHIAGLFLKVLVEKEEIRLRLKSDRQSATRYLAWAIKTEDISLLESIASLVKVEKKVARKPCQKKGKIRVREKAKRVIYRDTTEIKAVDRDCIEVDLLQDIVTNPNSTILQTAISTQNAIIVNWVLNIYQQASKTIYIKHLERAVAVGCMEIIAQLLALKPTGLIPQDKFLRYSIEEDEPRIIHTCLKIGFCPTLDQLLRLLEHVSLPINEAWMAWTLWFLSKHSKGSMDIPFHQVQHALMTNNTTLLKQLFTDTENIGSSSSIYRRLVAFCLQETIKMENIETVESIVELCLKSPYLFELNDACWEQAIEGSQDKIGINLLTIAQQSGNSRIIEVVSKIHEEIDRKKQGAISKDIKPLCPSRLE